MALTSRRLECLAGVTAMPVAAVLGYAVATRGALAAGGIVAVLGVGALLLVALNRLSVALVPLVVLVPLAGYLNVRWPEAGYSVIFDALVLLPLAALVMRALVPGRSVDLVAGPQALLGLFILVALLQFANPSGSSAAVSVHGLRQMVVPMLLVFVGYHLDLSSSRRLRRFAWAFVLSAVVPALWALKQHVLGLDGVEQEHARSIGTFWVDEEIRVFATFRSPWELAGYVGPAALVALSLAAAARTAAPRVLALGAWGLATAALLFTYVRGCLLGYAVGLLFLVVTLVGSRFGMRRTMIAFTALVGGYVIFALSLGPLIVDTVASDSVAARRAVTILAPAREEAVAIRLAEWSKLGDLVADNPWGIGLGTTGGVSQRFESELPRGNIQPDNVYLAVALETGWIGALVFVAIVLRVLVAGLRACRSGTDDVWVRRGAVACLIMIAVGNLAAPITFGVGGSHVFWLVSGIVAAADPSRLHAAPRPRGRR
jgi:putative inorganic carbon (hco3(-)) transporter